MKTSLTLLLALSAVAVLGACTESQRATARAPGHYESETTSVDAYGTKVKRETSTDVSVDEDGDKRAVVKSKTTRDPKGLFNKSTTKSKEVIEER